MVSFLHIDGLLTQRGNKLDVETGSSSIVFRSPSYSLANKLALRFKGRLLLADGLRRIGLRDAELLVNNLPLRRMALWYRLPRIIRHGSI